MTNTLASIQALPLIGEGNFRRVYRDGNYVYKVETVDGKEFDSNRNEFNNTRLLMCKTLPDNVRVPVTHMMEVEGEPVIAMQYVEGKLLGDCTCIPGESHEDCLPPGMERDLHVLGIDLAYGNVILSDGTYWLVDLDADLR